MANVYTPVDPKGRSIAGGRIGGGVGTIGEALTIDLGKRGRAYVMPRVDINGTLSQRYRWILSKQFGFKVKRNYQSFSGQDLAEFAEVSGRVALHEFILKNGNSTRMVPAIIAFDDDSDPSTLFVVDPNQLNKVFGPNVTLDGIFLEMTSDSPTLGQIETYLPWLSKKREIAFPRLSLRMPNGNLRSSRDTPLKYRINHESFYAN